MCTNASAHHSPKVAQRAFVGAGTDKWAEELQSRAAHAELAVAEARKELATVAAARTRAEAELEEFRRATTSHTADLQAQVRPV